MKKAGIRVLLGLSLLAIAGLLGVLAIDPLDGESKGELLQFFGRFHPAVLHLPFGVIALLVLVEVFSRGKGSDKLSAVVPLALGLAIATSLLAVGTGILLAMGEGASEPLVKSHMRDGILLTIGLLVLGIAKMAGLKGGWAYRGGLAVCVALLLVASHQGGSLTHGSGYLTKHLPNGLRPLFGMEKEEERKIASKDELLVFKDLIQPMMEQNCLSCHNPDKLKGELNLESYEGHLAGGEMGPAVLPYNLEESELYFRITLPKDDDEFMPPEEKPPLSDAEVALIAWWIEMGASEAATVAECGTPPAIVDQLIAEVFRRRVSPEELEQRERERKELYAALSNVREETGALILPLEADADSFRLEAFAAQKQFGDEELRVLEPYAETFVSADLSRTQITDAAVGVLAKFTNLRSLNLAGTKLSGKALGQLAQLSRLESLNLYGSKIEEEHLNELAQLGQLKKLYLFQTELGEGENLGRLRLMLPNCEIGSMN